MATNIPPHNLGELVDVLCVLIHNPEATVSIESSGLILHYLVTVEISYRFFGNLFFIIKQPLGRIGGTSLYFL